MPFRWPWNQPSPARVEFSELGWDLHSHMVPGVDDGAADLEAALAMVKGMAKLGYHGLVITPHIMADLYPNTPETLRPAFARLVQAVEEQNIPMKLHLAAEYHLDHEFMAAMEHGELLTIPWAQGGVRKKLILVEFGFHQPPEKAMVEEALFTLQTRGLTPLLAHCERYPYLHADDGLLALWAERGGWLSVNAASLGGAYGPETKAMAERAMDRGWVSFVCSDAHGERHVHAVSGLARSRSVRQWLDQGHSKHLGLTLP